MTATTPLVYDYRGTLLEGTGISENDLRGLESRLTAARDDVVRDEPRLLTSGGEIPAEKQPLDAGFFQLPATMLDDYRASPQRSELGRILSVTRRLSEEVDRVVVLGIGGSYMGARALMEACCHPYHNQLSRAQRGGRPRLYFAGNNVDNDASQALFDLLSSDQRWALVVISKSGKTLETAIAFRQFLDLLRRGVENDAAKISRLVVPVTGADGNLRPLARALGCQEIFDVPVGVGGRCSVLSAVGLLPVAFLGLDVVQLLQGAVDMNARASSAPLGDNPALDYAAVSHLLEAKRNATMRILSVWSSALESLGLWYDQLLSESLGKQEQGATPITVVNTRDLHSRAQQHQQGRRDKLITNVIVENWRRDPLTVGRSDLNQDQLNQIAERTLPEVMTAAVQGTNEAYRADGRPTADIRLAAVNEHSLGQLMQMLMIATAIEGRLIRINPYGQPGVEDYKCNMQRLLNFT